MNKVLGRIFTYTFLVILLSIMLYPLVWLLASSFRTNEEIFMSLNLIPKNLNFEGYILGWHSVGSTTFSQYFLNSSVIVTSVLVGVLLSSILTAYAFAKFRFRFKKILFALMLSSLLLPSEVLLIPRYLMFNALGWVDTYKPLIVPFFFATDSFFIFMLVQFFRSLPKELEDAATIDGCNSFVLLIKIIIPLSAPALLAVSLFAFVGTWNSYYNPLIYISSVKNFTIPLALRMSMDLGETIYWNRIMAMSTIALVPPILLYAFIQKQFVEGIVTTGIKG